jgi:arsenical pump membrane protein
MIAFTLFIPKLSVKGITVNTYWIVVLLGALLLFAFGFIGFKEAFGGITSKGAINPVKLLALFLSVTVLSIFLDETGFFRYLANAVLKRAGSNQFILFTAFYLTTSLVTVFTSNDIVILTFTPFLCYFAKNAKIDPIPYLVSAFVAANTCSMLLIIGNPTNIYLATANGIDFIAFFKVMALPTLFAVLTAYAVLLLLFFKKLKTPISVTGEEAAIENKPLFAVSLTLLLVCTALLAVSSYIDVEMWLIAVIAAGLLIAAALLISLIKGRRPIELKQTVKRVPWELIPFVLSMFVMALALEKYEVTAKLASLFGEDRTILVYGFASALFANLINNIPMSVLFSSILSAAVPAVSEAGVYASVIGSNIGAFLTPMGALAGIMWLNILKKNEIDFSFAKFVKFGIVLAVPILSAALLGLMISL